MTDHLRRKGVPGFVLPDSTFSQEITELTEIGLSSLRLLR